MTTSRSFSWGVPPSQTSTLCAAALCAMSSVSCATIATGAYAKPMDPQGHLAHSPTTTSGLRISGTEVPSLSSPLLGLVAFTFENTSATFVHITNMKVSFGAPEKDMEVEIPWGSDVTSWERAISERNAIREVNTRALLGTAALAGTAVAATNRGTTVGAAGGMIAAGSFMTLVGRGLAAETSAGIPASFPDTHLLSGPLSIPPGLFSRRWILLYAKDDASAECIDSMLLDYQTGGKRERVWLAFRKPVVRGAPWPPSEWQARTCYPTDANGVLRKP